MNSTPPETLYIPKGSMCLECIHAQERCDHLDFTKMQVIGHNKEYHFKLVLCTEYRKDKNENS